MKKIYFYSAALVMLLAAFFISSCQVEIAKRLYGGGYYVDWHWKQGLFTRAHPKTPVKKLEKSREIAVASNPKEENKPLSLLSPVQLKGVKDFQLNPALNSSRPTNKNTTSGVSNSSQTIETDIKIKGDHNVRILNSQKHDEFPYLPFAMLTGALLLLTPPARKSVIKSYQFLRRF